MRSDAREMMRSYGHLGPDPFRPRTITPKTAFLRAWVRFSLRWCHEAAYIA